MEAKTIGQIVLRLHIQKSIVAIPKSIHKERIEENFDIFDFELSDADMTKSLAEANDVFLSCSNQLPMRKYTC